MANKKTAIILLFILIFLSTACMINVGGPDYPVSSIPVSTDALATLESQIQTAIVSSDQTGQMTVFITETQLTSYLANKFGSQENPFITRPQAYLQNGQIQIYGTVTKGYFSATVSMLMTASIDPEGKLVLELSAADFGPFPVPETIKEMTSSIITEAYTGLLGPIATGFRLDSIIISYGAMMLIGKLK